MVIGDLDPLGGLFRFAVARFEIERIQFG